MTDVSMTANGTGNGTFDLRDMSPTRIFVDRYVTPIIWLFGFPGNIFAFFIWMQKRMRHSSGCYLAALALADLLFLTLHVMLELHGVWDVNVLHKPVFCEMYTVLFLASQYLSPLLVLGFTVERYISVCHPFMREKFCTTRRAVIVIVCFIVSALLLCSIQGYFWTYQDGLCDIREEVAVGGTKSLWSVWTWITEMLIFLFVPLLVLIFNILVIKEARHLSKMERTQLRGCSQKSSATTIMLLAVSFYLIITTLPATTIYALYYSFPAGDWNMTDIEKLQDPVWQRHLPYLLARVIIQEVGISHYAFNFYIYMLTGKLFRKEVHTIFHKVLCNKLFNRWSSDYDNFRTSAKGSSTYSTRISVNGNSKKTEGETFIWFRSRHLRAAVVQLAHICNRFLNTLIILMHFGPVLQMLLTII